MCVFRSTSLLSPPPPAVILAVVLETIELGAALGAAPVNQVIQIILKCTSMGELALFWLSPNESEVAALGMRLEDAWHRQGPVGTPVPGGFWSVFVLCFWPPMGRSNTT